MNDFVSLRISPRFVRAVVCSIPLLFVGCASQQPKALDTLYHAYETDRVAQYRDPNSAEVLAAKTNPRSRNDLMNDMILMIDHSYGEIEKSLYGHKAWADFGGSVLATGLGTAGTLSGGEGIKTTLSALVTAIDSTKTSFNKDILQGQSIIAIIATMRKMRAEKLLEIRAAQKLPIGGYPLSMGFDDLLEYYNAGTFVGALQGLTEDASAAKKAADVQLKIDKAGISAVPQKLIPASPIGIVPTTSAARPPAASTGSAVPAKSGATRPEGVVETVR